MDKIWFLPKKPHIKRVLFHAINHVGLGHINRSIAIAQWLQAAIPDLQILFLIEGGEDFIDPTGYPWILIPGQASEYEHIEQITRRTIEFFQPDMMIHETLLRPPIHRPVREAGLRQVVMGSLGDALRDQFRYNLTLLNEVDLLIVLQQQEEVLQTDRELITRYTGKTLYAGPLVRRKTHLSSEALRQKLGLTSEHKVIFVTFGGGGWDFARGLLHTLLAARERIQTIYPQVRLIAIPGPHFSGELPDTDDFVCYVSRFEPFLQDYINIASAVVMMAGYSTINEIASCGVPAVCIPAPDAEDQVGPGGMGEYAQTFPNITVSSTDAHTLIRDLLTALAKPRNLSVVHHFWQRAESASDTIVHAIKEVLYTTL
jgi:UDP-N-acetylglucosamine--N-acetylmuramyl-(pentapeptide) pyrophosphoryl-undecaprenol N-acetylglucosamine transferase